ncbi:MAG TPA: insulinase family protein, partial [Candidatus Dormibacteraeota bacterium]
GVAHILEHVVLAGSQKYPVHDPFFSMTRRSLATFMNAFTSADWTMYPFSTRNPKDFANLLDVYLDATFFPRLEEDAFMQEGIRFEFEAPDDPQSGLRYKGVVFNEMKGALASPQATMQHAIGKALFPGLTYEHISGGDPEHIPELTWQKLRDFHAVHYHPSNAYFYTYGNRSLETTLETIEESVLARFERIDIDTTIPYAKRFTKPIEVVEQYPGTAGDDPKKKSQSLVAWVTVPSRDSFQMLAMKVLTDTLLGNAGAPLRKALIDSRLGTALADGTGLQDDFKQAVFGAGLKDVDAAKADQVQQVVIDTLDKIAGEGIDRGLVDAVVHRLEFEKRERSNAGFPYSLKVLFGLLPAYNYGGDPYSALNFDADLARFEDERLHNRYLENLIGAELLENPHRALITIVPDADLEERKHQRELSRLASIEGTLAEPDRNQIVEDAQRLKAAQDAKQDLSVLPTLELTDIPMKFEPLAPQTRRIGGATVDFYALPTNGVSYIDIRSDFSVLDRELQELLPLFGRALTQSGAAGRDYVELARRIAAVTGGVGASAQVQSRASVEDFVESFVLSGKALDRNAEPFVELLSDLTARLEIAPARLKEVIAESATRLESSLANLGFQFALLLAQSKLTSEGALNERLQGIQMLHSIRELAKLDEKQLGPVIEKLQTIRMSLFRQESIQVVVTCEESMVDPISDYLAALVDALPSGRNPQAAARPVAHDAAPEARIAPVPVAFNVRAFRTVRYTNADAPALLVLANYLRDTFIHRELREKGGAYGGFAQASTAAGIFLLGSYRDPNITRTYDAYDRAVRWVLDSPIEPEHLKEAILGACGDVDPLESPDIKGRREAVNRLTGFTLRDRERFKQRLLQTTADDLRRVTSRYLDNGSGVQVTVAGAELIESARKEQPALFEVVEPV